MLNMWLMVKKQRMYRTDFETYASGVVLVPVDASKTIEPNYAKNKRLERLGQVEIMFIVIALVAVLSMIGLNSGSLLNIDTLIIIMLDVIGVILTSLIINKTIKNSGRVADKLCNLLKEHNCTDILELPVAKLFGLYGWGEIGLSYFLVSAVSLLVVPSMVLVPLSVLSCVALSYSCWSIWYQKVRAKSWCMLCLMVQLVIVLQAVIGFYELYNYDIVINDAKVLLILGFFMAVSTLVANRVVKILAKSLEADKWYSKLTLLKYNDDIVNNLFDQQPSYDVSDNASTIVFGPNEAKYKITILSNPYCMPCARIHDTIKQFYLAGCQIQYVFTSFNEDLAVTNRYLIGSYLSYEQNVAWDLYNRWYDGGFLQKEAFFDKSFDANLKGIDDELDKHNRWKSETGFSATPTVLINGKPLPKEFSLDDMVHMVLYNN